ncbi:prephenate dehydratase [bacterium]|nr:prephenate dehydratase [bacterium]
MNLEELRENIDKLDRQILQILNDRANIVKQIARIKQETHREYHDPAREEEILRNLQRLNPGSFPSMAVRPVFREIMSACLSLEKPISVVYLGPEATFTHMAAMKKFGSSTGLVPVKSIETIFSEVERGRADYGVVPVENTSEGVVSHTLDMFVSSDLKICAEVMMEVHHNLLSRSASLSEIERIFSHPQAVAQSRAWLRENLPFCQITEVSSTARAAELACQDPKAGAIASELAANIYDLNILCSRIEDMLQNYTRFLVIGHNLSPKTGRDKTSIIFSIKDRIGALYHMLKPFAEKGINLTKIESRPTKKQPWEYIFFVDFIGHMEDEKTRQALDELEEQCIFLKVLGSYPVADTKDE